MSNATIDALDGGRGLVGVLVSIAFPNSQTVRVGLAPYTSATGWHFYGKMLTISDLTITPSDRDGVPPSAETTVEIDDTDRTISRIRSGQYADSVRGSAATIYLATPSVASSGWFSIPMKVTKVTQPRPFVAAVVLRIDDDQLRRKGMSGWGINRASWPSAPPESIGLLPPIIYGSFDSINLQNGPGMAGPCILVNASTFKYVVCAGRAKTQVRVFKDGVKVTSPPAFAYETVNGRDYTTMTFGSDQGDSVITVDLDGLTDAGDGTGAVIQNGMTQLAHKLTNFILGDWKTGAWLTTSSLLDATYLAAAEAFFDDAVPYSTDYVSERQTGFEAIASLASSYRMASWWDWSGTLAFVFEDANMFAAPYSGTRVQWQRDETAPLVLDEDDTNLTTRVSISLTPSATQGYLTAFEVMDPGAPSEATGTLDIANGEAK